MKISVRASRKGRFEQWPLAHAILLGTLKLLLFLQGAAIVLPHGAAHVAVLVLLWILSYPVIHYGMCRTCVYYGRRCPVPGEGNLVHRLFDKRESSPGLAAWSLVGLCYLMRLGYPLLFLIGPHSRPAWWHGAFYVFSIVVFFLVLTRVIGCPYCTRYACPLNPDYPTRAGDSSA